MTPQDQVINRVRQFEQLHDAFYTYFSAKLSKDDSKYAKYRLQLLTVYWEELDLTRVVYPLFESFSCTLAEKQAVARAALYDALVAHTFGSYLDHSAQALHARMDDLEKSINQTQANAAAGSWASDNFSKLNASVGQLSERLDKVASGAEAVVTDFSSRVTNLEKQITGEKTNAIPKRKQAVVRQKAGQQE